MRLIDADALGIGKANRDCFDDPKYADGWNNAIEIINNASTIETEPVVRCKDCRWYQNRKWDDGKPEYDCRKTQGLLDVRPEDFCSYGERRTDE